MALPSDQIDTRPLTEKEIDQLSHEGMVALGARCALRVQPMFIPATEVAVDARYAFLTVDACLTIATAYSVGHSAEIESPNSGYGSAALSAARAAAGDDSPAVAVARAAFRAAAGADAVDDAFAAVVAARAVAATATAAPEVSAASRYDHVELVKAGLMNRQGHPKHVPMLFFNNPLWLPMTSPPAGWDEVMRRWGDALENAGLSSLHFWYQNLLTSNFYDLDAALKRLEEWKTLHKRRSAGGTVLRSEAEQGRGEHAEDHRLPAQAPPTDTPPPAAPRPHADVATVMGDSWSKVDLLGRAPLIKAIAGLLAAEKQDTPLTIALLGEWGAGKTTLMRLVQERIEKGAPGRFDFAWFNAWEYEHTKNMAAGLAREVVEALTEKLGAVRRAVLRVRFATDRHGWGFARALLKLSVWAVAAASAGWFAVDMFGKDDKQLETVLSSAVFVGVFAFGKELWRNTSVILSHPLAAELTTYLNLPEYQEHLGYIPVLKGDIATLCRIKLGGMKSRRLVVFVDDLDRCDPECITQTFDAIRLVMDVPHVIVVAGIDQRVALRAVAERYEEMADANQSKEEIARDYLGKIIQLPIRLASARDDEIKQFVTQKLFDIKVTGNDPFALGPPTELQLIQEQAKDALARSQRRAMIDILPSEPPADMKTMPIQPGRKKGLTDAQRRFLERSEAHSRRQVDDDRLGNIDLPDATDDRDRFAELAKLFELRNPRQLTRLRNTYRLLRLIRNASPEGAEGRPLAFTDKELTWMLFWLEFLHSQSAADRASCRDMFFRQDTKNEPTKACQDTYQSLAPELRDCFALTKVDGKEWNAKRARFELCERFVERVVLPSADALPRPPESTASPKDDVKSQSAA